MNTKSCKWSEEIKIPILVIENIYSRKLRKVHSIMGSYPVIKLTPDDTTRDVSIFFYNHSTHSNASHFIKCSLGVQMFYWTWSKADQKMLVG